MGARDTEDMGYRTALTPKGSIVPVTSDEQDYTTLKAIRELLQESVDGLSKDFNLFDVLSEGTDDAKRDHMMRLIAGKQIAFDILSPLLERVVSAMATADDNYVKRNKK